MLCFCYNTSSALMVHFRSTNGIYGSFTLEFLSVLNFGVAILLWEDGSQSHLQRDVFTGALL